jgi:hypothetical protein
MLYRTIILYQQPAQYALLIQLFPLMNIWDDNQIISDEHLGDRSICMPPGLWRPCPSGCTPRDDQKHRYHNHIQLHGLIDIEW